MLAVRRLPNLKGEKPMKNNIAVLLVLLAGGCASGTNPYSQGSSPDMNVQERGTVPPMDPRRKVDAQDCSRPIESAGGNLLCRGEPSEAQKRAAREEEERLARLRKEAADRAAREAAERERIAREAREAAERAERERLAALEAERLRLEAERRAKLEEEERQARARKEAEERAAREAAERERAEREAREAAERERQRLEEEWLAGRAYLEKFVATYGSVQRFKGVSGQINTFLDKTR